MVTSVHISPLLTSKFAEVLTLLCKVGAEGRTVASTIHRIVLTNTLHISRRPSRRRNLVEVLAHCGDALVRLFELQEVRGVRQEVIADGEYVTEVEGGEI